MLSDERIDETVKVPECRVMPCEVELSGVITMTRPCTYTHAHAQVQVTERVLSHDPEKEVAILFAFKGQVGLNVIRPTYSPRYIFEMSRGKK